MSSATQKLQFILKCTCNFNYSSYTVTDIYMMTIDLNTKTWNMIKPFKTNDIFDVL